MSKASDPNGFLWGAATSSQQIEGGVREGGRSESIWDRFAAKAGKIADGSNADVACDHYHRWREDLGLLSWLGVNAYRFSVAWPRILPKGRGPINPAGLDFYDALVDALLERGIRPFVTLFHWDLPQVLQEEGGWTERSTCDAFVEYAAAVSKRLGDRVGHWATHNEPWVISTLGYESGEHAPGIGSSADALAVSHHLLLSHGWATNVIRENSPDAEVGIVLNLTPASPASESPRDKDATRWFDGVFNRWYLDPLFRGEYPADSIADRVRRGHLPEDNMPFVEDGDLEAICAPMDYLGVNYYSRVVMQHNGLEPEAVPPSPGDAVTDMGFEVFPQGLHDLLVRLKEEYGPRKIYVTENGAAYGEGPDARGRVRDARRVEFLRSHITAIQRALTEGVPVAGYFVWSLLDNFEWAHGYQKRFGLFHVDFETLERVAKDSAIWYRNFIGGEV